MGSVRLTRYYWRLPFTGALSPALSRTPWTLLPIEALQGKPVAIVAMGATLHHYLGAESHLRDILAWFGALTLPVGVYLSSSDFVDGQLSEKAAANLDQLLATAVACAGALSSTALTPAPLAAATPRKG